MWTASNTLGDAPLQSTGGLLRQTQVTALEIARGTTAEAPLATTPGRLRWNTTTARPTISNGTAHVDLPMQLTTTSTLDFPSIGSHDTANLTVTVTGATPGDAVVLGVPDAAMPNGGTYMAWVSATDTVTVRFQNASTTQDPASGTFRITVLK